MSIEPPDWPGDDDEEAFAPRAATCNRCGATDLEWVDIGVGWRLYEGATFHRCKAISPATADDFETLP